MPTTDAVQVVQAALGENRPSDEETHRCVGILRQRLDHLKRQSTLFQNIVFSEDVDHLAGRSAAVAVN